MEKPLSDEHRRQRFLEVVVPHLDDALSLARWLTGNSADGEDVVQDASIRALAAIDKLRDGNPKAWVLTIVRNTAFTWLAKNRPKKLLVTSDDEVFERATIDSSVLPDAAMIAKTEAAMLAQAIESLPLPFKETLVLRDIDGLSYQEIASVTSMPIGTVMSRLSRARTMLIAKIRLTAELAPSDKEGAA